MVEVREVHTDTNKGSCRTNGGSLKEMLHLLIPQCVHKESDNHEKDEEEVVVRHLHVVSIDLKGSEHRRNDKAPKVLTPVCQNYSGNHRRQISQRHYFPQVTGGNDDEEVTGESPYHSTQGCHPLTEVEGTEQDIETEKVGENEPHILWQPQVVGIHSLVQSVHTLVRRHHLIRGHAAEHRIGPTRRPTGLLLELSSLHHGTLACRGVVTIKNPSLYVGGEKVCKRHCRKEQHHQYVW